MSMQGPVEQITVVISRLKDHVTEIRTAYCLMPDIVDQEHEAIKASDLERCEELSQRKMEIGNRIEAEFAEIKQVVRNLVFLFTDEIKEQVTAVDTLSDAFLLIDKIMTKLKTGEEPTTVAEHLYEGLKDELEKFLQIKSTTQSKIEVNRIVLTSVLANRQENYRFWQEVAADSMAAYSPDGKQRAKKRGSTLAIKA